LPLFTSLVEMMTVEGEALTAMLDAVETDALIAEAILRELVDVVLTTLPVVGRVAFARTNRVKSEADSLMMGI
jgi:hypothetical protein